MLLMTLQGSREGSRAVAYDLMDINSAFRAFSLLCLGSAEGAENTHILFIA